MEATMPESAPVRQAFHPVIRAYTARVFLRASRLPHRSLGIPRKIFAPQPIAASRIATIFVDYDVVVCLPVGRAAIIDAAPIKTARERGKRSSGLDTERVSF